MAGLVRVTALARLFALVLLALLVATQARAEFGDVLLNERSEAEGVRPVVFPHWFHRVRYQCRVCHTQLGFELRAGATHTSMDEIANGKFCGACHDGDIAWPVEHCDLCHSGRPGMRTGVRGSHQTLGPGRL